MGCDCNSAEIKSGYGIGGSASGLDSFVVLGDEFVVAAGGGGGAVCYHVVDTTNAGCFGGTDGASGSTNSSSTSYIKIYRL